MAFYEYPVNLSGTIGVCLTDSGVAISLGGIVKNTTRSGNVINPVVWNFLAGGGGDGTVQATLGGTGSNNCDCVVTIGGWVLDTNHVRLEVTGNCDNCLGGVYGAYPETFGPIPVDFTLDGNASCTL